ncbi:MAG: WD40 repeat domain-containing protein [Bryobacterales bacterium]|nr:WD40 repeat domain-containing protein [Bryobacterales bacterium]
MTVQSQTRNGKWLTTMPVSILVGFASALVGLSPSVQATDAGSAYRVRPGIEISSHRAAIWTMQFVPPDGRSVLTSSRESLIAWHTARPSNARRLSEGSRLIGNAVSPDGSRVAFTAASGAQILDIRSGRVTLEFDHDSLRELTYPAWSPTGDRLSTQTRTHVNIWHPDTGELLRSIDLQGLGRRGLPLLAWSPSGERIAVLGTFGTLRVYRAADGGIEFEAHRHEGVTRNLAWSSDERLVATGGNDGLVNLWSTVDWTLQRSILNEGTIFLGDRSAVDSIAFSKDGDRIAVSAPLSTIRVWSTSTGKEVAFWSSEGEASYIPHTGQVVSMAFSPDDRFLLTGSLDTTAKVWEVETGAQVAAPQSFREGIRAVAWSQDGIRYGAASSDGSVRIWDSASHAEIARFAGHDGGSVVSLSYAPGVARVATAGEDGTVRIWQTGTGYPLFEIARLDGAPRPFAQVGRSPGAVSYSPESNKIAILFGRLGGELQIRDVTSEVSPPAYVGGYVDSFDWSPDGRRLAVAGSGGLSVVDAHDLRGRAIWLIGSGSIDEQISHVSWSGDGERVLSASDSGARLWDWRTGMVVSAVRPQGSARYAEASGDGSMLLTGSGRIRATVVQVWDIPTESELARVEAGRGEQLEAHFVAQGSPFVVRRLRSRPPELSPWIWDSSAGQQLFALEGHSAPVVAMAVSGDGQLIATAAADREVRVWSAAGGKAVATMSTGLSTVRGLAFGPRDRTIAAFGNGGAQSWTLHPLLPSGSP